MSIKSVERLIDLVARAAWAAATDKPYDESAVLKELVR